MNRVHRQTGFTLVELLVTMLVVAILVGVAVPTYTSSVQKSRRTDGRSALLDLAAREERYMSTATSYSAAASDLGYASLPASVGAGYYSLSITAAAASGANTATYTATATAIGAQAKDTTCATLSVNQLGARSALSAASADTTSTCWPGN